MEKTEYRIPTISGQFRSGDKEAPHECPYAPDSSESFYPDHQYRCDSCRIYSGIAWCKLLIKAGIPWERLFVPIYGTYTQFAVAGCGCYFWVLLAAALLFPAVMGCASASSSEDLPVVLMLIYIVLALEIAFLYCRRLARSYGKGTGFGIGLFLLLPLFIVILGFGSSVYEP